MLIAIDTQWALKRGDLECSPGVVPAPGKEEILSSLAGGKR
jgi:hypothetical protein